MTRRMVLGTTAPVPPLGDRQVFPLLRSCHSPQTGMGREDSLAGRRLDHSPPAMNRHREADCACPLPVIREQSGQPHTGLQTCGRSFAMRKQWIRRDGQFVAKPTLCATMECLAGNGRMRWVIRSYSNSIYTTKPACFPCNPFSTRSPSMYSATAGLSVTTQMCGVQISSIVTLLTP